MDSQERVGKARALSEVSGFRPTERFSGRVERYIAFRPSYPKELLLFMKDELGLAESHSIADVGSGTGLLSKLFLDNGNIVYGVEPNAEMRAAAEAWLEDEPGFRSISGRAEEMPPLKDHEVDYIVAGQAFHWFDAAAARGEFGRILKPGGWVVLVWNRRRIKGTPFAAAYEDFVLRWGTDYEEVRSRYGAAGPLDELFGESGYDVRTFANRQELDYAGLEGRVLSASYIPGPTDPNYSTMLEDLRGLFDTNARDGKVVMELDTEAFFGQLD